MPKPREISQHLLVRKMADIGREIADLFVAAPTGTILGGTAPKRHCQVDYRRARRPARRPRRGLSRLQVVTPFHRAISQASGLAHCGSPVRAMVLLALLWAAATSVSLGAQAGTSATAEARAVAYLAVEVPRWRREHPCYSCHNNGDATRALLVAASSGHAIGSALDDTLAWLAAPEQWEQNARRGGSEDLPLARIQFAGALASMTEAGSAGQDALDRAAALLIPHQGADGSWQLNASQILGGATAYGRALATASARRVLARATSDAARASRARADAWLRSAEALTVLDASSVLIGLEGASDASAADQRARCLMLLKEGQAPDGGWGPYVTSQSEAFDTALAMLALSGLSGGEASGSVYSTAELGQAIERGRSYLTASQADDGGWVETTRPPGLESYAQRISTTAWALLALLSSEPSSP